MDNSPTTRPLVATMLSALHHVFREFEGKVLAMVNAIPPQRPVTHVRQRKLDRRLIAGLALIVASTGGAYVFISAANATEDVYVVRDTLLAGDPIDASNLRAVPVALAGVSDSYIRVGSLVGDAVATRTIAAGEMLPTKAVGSSLSVTAARLVISVSDGLATDTEPGTSVDVWATLSDPYSSMPSSSSIIVPGATFSRFLESDAYAVDNTQRVELLVPRSTLRDLLAAQGDGANLVVVPTVSRSS